MLSVGGDAFGPFCVLCVCACVDVRTGAVSHKTKRKDGEKPYDWAVVLGGTKYVPLSPNSPTNLTRRRQ